MTWERTNALVQRVSNKLIGSTKAGRRTFFDADEFAWTAQVEDAYPAIRAELDELLDERASIPAFEALSPPQAAISSDGGWQTYFLYAFGREVPTNLARCPNTARAVKAIPGMTTAMFSVLAPHKHLPPHAASTKNVLRYHLGLKVPSTDARLEIRVGDEIRSWTEGRSLVFDDTFEHEVWNDTDEERVVLFVDFLRPLPGPLAMANKFAVQLTGRTQFVDEIAVEAENFGRR